MVRWLTSCMLVTALVGIAAGCADVAPEQVSAAESGTPDRGPSTAVPPEPSPAPTGPPTAVPTSPEGSGRTGAEPGRSASRPAPTAPATPRPVPLSTPVRLQIPALGIDRLRVVPYTGTADDAPGTVIQNRGVAASPRGARGGIGPGELGNFLVTAHRTTHGRPFGDLPELAAGQHVLITAGGTVYDYVITQTMKISFRKPADLARQNAAVPGRPGVAPTRAMITLSTCATPEDHAEGNYWSDAQGNPEHRINKIGVLAATRPAG